MVANIRLSSREKAVLEKLLADSESKGFGIIQNAHVDDLGPKQFAGIVSRLSQKGIIELPKQTVFRLRMDLERIRRILATPSNQA